MRGFDIDAVLCMREEYYENWSYLSEVFGKRGIHFATVSPPAPFLPNPAEDEQQMREYYQRITEKEDAIPAVIERLQQSHAKRLAALEAAPREAREHFWWPFLQHQHVESDSQVLNIDSAHRDCFETFTDSASTPTTLTANRSSSLLQPTYDGSASWWTQCLGHSNPDLALAAAYAAGRYGHVIFPQAVYEPALDLSKRLLECVGKHWASKVFFSDDGSTGMEVALKMALRAYSKRYAIAEAERPNLGILGLKGSYHGDTIGSMDASEKSVYSKSVEWYRGRGFWLDPPTVAIKGDQAAVSFDGQQWQDEDGCTKEDACFSNLAEVYDVEARLNSPLAHLYRNHILSMLQMATSGPDPVQLGALVLEPVVMGAAGMLFVDPLFQRTLVDTVRSPAAAATLATEKSDRNDSKGWANLPVVFDEVFVGLYRLGKASASDFLGCKPDVACFAKILTGGLVPMSVTLASQEIYDTFLGPTKVEALLHGHSYTAHPVGCSVANKALEILDQLDMVPYMSQWSDDASATVPAVWSLWDQAVVEKLATLETVESAMALGCVLAIKLVNTTEIQGAHPSTLLSALRRTDVNRVGYSASLGADVLQTLRPLLRDQAGMDIHTRPLGDVLYVMSSLNTSRETLAQLEDCLVEVLL